MKRTSKQSGIFAIIGIALALGAGTAQAADSTWTNTASTTFNDANAWNNGEPGTADKATFNSGASYTVTFDATKTNTQAILNLGGQNVTWNLNGNTYRLSDSLGVIATNASDTGTLTIMNGALRFPGNPGFSSGAGINVVVTNGGFVGTGFISGYMTVGGTLTIDGPSSGAWVVDGGRLENVLVRNGSTNNFLRSPIIKNMTIDNGTVMGWGGLVSGVGGFVGTINLTNGGVYTASQTPQGPRAIALGYDEGFAWVNVGGGSGTSLLEGAAISWNRNGGGTGHMAIYSNGLARITSNTHPLFHADYGSTDFRINAKNAVTLLGGTIQMTNGSWMTLANTGPASGPGILRGYGTVTNYSTGTKFSIVNNAGWIKPGDTGTNWNHNIVGLGAINISGGDLYQTNPLSTKSSAIFFDFSDTALDQINISGGGSAIITGGSNVWSLASGSAPLGHYKYGLGVYDFITASNITWTPQVANLTNLLFAAGLIQNVDYQFGLVDLGGGLQALRLAFVPEPSTMLLLLGGGLVLWRFRRGKGRNLLIVALLCLTVGNARALNQAWTTGSGDYTNTANWSGAAKPIAGDTATFGTSGTYNVTFTGAEFSDFLQVTNTDNVTFLLGGNTYRVDNGSSEVYVGSNATDNVKLIVNNGTLDAEGSGGGSQLAPNGSTASLVISNGGKFLYNNLTMGDKGTVLVSDGGSQLYGGGGSLGVGNGTLIVSNGATAYLANMSTSSGTNIYTGVGTVVTNDAGTTRSIGAANGLYMLLDGAKHESVNQFEMGVFSGTGQKAIIGDGGANTSILTSANLLFGTTFDAARGAPEMIINAGGIVRAGTPDVVNTTNVTAWIYDQGTLTLNGGTLQVRTNSAVYVANLNANANKGLLRGSGTISALAGTDKIFVYNEGNIRPGDTNATARIGTLNLVQGNLVQGNGAGVLNFDFNGGLAGSADLINIIGGNALITSGSNIFNNTSGTLTFGKWDFITATVITNLPVYDNLTNLINGLTNTLPAALFVGYTYGVVDLPGGGQALELSINMIPEPSTILLIFGGGLVAWRFRRRK